MLLLRKTRVVSRQNKVLSVGKKSATDGLDDIASLQKRVTVSEKREK